jgi:hypothetical protein
MFDVFGKEEKKRRGEEVGVCRWLPIESRLRNGRR